MNTKISKENLHLQLLLEEQIEQLSHQFIQNLDFV